MNEDRITGQMAGWQAALLARDVGQELPRCVAVVRKTLAGDPLDTP